MSCRLLLIALALTVAGGCPRPQPPGPPDGPNRADAGPGPDGAPPRAAPVVRRAPPRPVLLTRSRYGLTARLRIGIGEVAAVRARGALFVAALDKVVVGFRRPTNEQLWRLVLPQKVVDLQLSVNAKVLLVTTSEGTNRIYEVGASGPPKRTKIWKRVKGVPKDKRGATQALVTDGAVMIRGDVRRSLRWYELATDKMKWLKKGDRVVVSRDGKTAVCVDGEALTVVDAAGRKDLERSPTPSKDAQPGAEAVGVANGGAVARLSLNKGGSCGVWFDDAKLRDIRGLGGKGECPARPVLVWSASGSYVALGAEGMWLVYAPRPGRFVSGGGVGGPGLRSPIPEGAKRWHGVTFGEDDLLYVANVPGPGEVGVYRLRRL